MLQNFSPDSFSEKFCSAQARPSSFAPVPDNEVADLLFHFLATIRAPPCFRD
jgi:hypothetical protein